MTASDRTKRAPAGFTLLELMVGIAILLTVMSGITMLFVGSMRALRQGEQAIVAHETARGALHILEYDLTTCFTSRAHGQYYSFYGTPIGMTFVGVAGDEDESDDENLSRVTYVLYRHDLNCPWDNPSRPQETKVGGREFRTTMVDPTDHAIEYDVIVKTRSLIRYVERNQSDLDTFPPPPGTTKWPEPGYGPPAEPNTPMFNLWQELYDAAYVGDVNLMDLAGKEKMLGDELYLAKKRELWLRMLAGDPLLPNMWSELDASPVDYVIAENILWRIEIADTGVVLWEMNQDDDSMCLLYGRTAMFDPDGPAGPAGPRVKIQETPYFNTFDPDSGIPGFDILDTATGLAALQPFWQTYATGNSTGDPLNPRLPEFVQVKFRVMLPSAYPGAPDFDRSFSTTIEIPSGTTRRTPRI